MSLLHAPAHLAIMVERDIVTHGSARRGLAVLRLGFGFTFAWAFLDRLLALGYPTGADSRADTVDRFGPAAWIDGGSPTADFLTNTVPADNPMWESFNSLAGEAWVDWLLMISLAGVGLALVLGVGIRIAAITGAALYLLMWLAAMPLENNPVMDHHLLGAIALPVLALTLAGDTWGLGTVWARSALVRKFPVLR